MRIRVSLAVSALLTVGVLAQEARASNLCFNVCQSSQWLPACSKPCREYIGGPVTTCGEAGYSCEGGRSEPIAALADDASCPASISLASEPKTLVEGVIAEQSAVAVADR